MAMASVPSGWTTTVGRRFTPSVDRMATWGWLMIGAVRKVPKGPALVIEKVPPEMSSALSFFVRARSASSRIRRAMPRSVSSSACLTTGHDEPVVVEVDGDPQVELMVHDERVVAHRGVEVRPLVQRLDRGAGHEGEVGEGEALLGPELGAVRTPDPLDLLVVGLQHDEGVGARRLRPDHVLGGAAADVGEGDDLVGAGRGRGAGAADATAAAGAARLRSAPARLRPARSGG